MIQRKNALSAGSQILLNAVSFVQTSFKKTESANTVTKAVVIVCDAVETACRCILEFGHEGPHQCDPRTCGGSWEYDEDDNFIIHSLPIVGRMILGFDD
jgi:3-dehydroquinate synthetase